MAAVNLTFQHTAILTDTLPAHVEAARQQTTATLWQQAYQFIAAGHTYTVTISETLVPVKGMTKGSLTRTLTLTG